MRSPVVSRVDRRLHERGITVVPDVLVNAGGVTVSYFEWVKNRQGYAWTLETVRDRLAEIMSRAFDAVWERHEGERVPVRDAAYGHAMHRIGEALAAQGDRAFFANDGG
jgi:glutamate dehydrogenase (NADP+)